MSTAWPERSGPAPAPSAVPAPPPVDGRAAWSRLPRLGATSLALRTTVTMLLVLGVVQAAALGLHTRDQREAERLITLHYTGQRVTNLYRIVLDTPVDRRPAVMRRLREETPGVTAVTITQGPDLLGRAPLPPRLQRRLRFTFDMMPRRLIERPLGFALGGNGRTRHFVFSLALADGSGWLTVAIHPPNRLFPDPIFPVAWLLMTLTAAMLTLWATRRLTAPVRTLASAAERLGRDVNAPPLPEDGPREIAQAAAAFNQMASRIRRFVSDRTFLVTAMGHDLRTPITRLKLRCEFIDDEDLRTRFLADLGELEQMVSATLAFGRDTAATEPAAPLDLVSLIRTVLDDAADANPDAADRIALATLPDDARLVIRGRSLPLKRCFANLVGNALDYGGSVRVAVGADAASGEALVTVDDDGPGIPPGDIERVFEPFRRGESSRSRETGGTGLGLSIARDIARAHGGGIHLLNRPGGGLRAEVRLPV